jgi:hypothetical protein
MLSREGHTTTCVRQTKRLGEINADSLDVKVRVDRIVPGYLAINPSDPQDQRNTIATPDASVSCRIYTGNIPMPVPGEVPTFSHSLCVVGYQDEPDGVFVLRNSWGDRWGIGSPYGPGHGTLRYQFMEAYGQEGYSIA